MLGSSEKSSQRHPWSLLGPFGILLETLRLRSKALPYSFFELLGSLFESVWYVAGDLGDLVVVFLQLLEGSGVQRALEAILAALGGFLRSSWE